MESHRARQTIARLTGIPLASAHSADLTGLRGLLFEGGQTGRVPSAEVHDRRFETRCEPCQEHRQPSVPGGQASVFCNRRYLEAVVPMIVAKTMGSRVRFE